MNYLRMLNGGVKSSYLELVIYLENVYVIVCICQLYERVCGFFLVRSLLAGYL